MLKLRTAIIFLLVTFFVYVSFADINSDLKNRKNELNKLQSSISTKKAEKDKLIKEEKKVKKELESVTKAIATNEKELKFLKTKIRNVEKNLNSASNQYNLADAEQQKFTRLINEQYFDYTKRKLVSFFDYPLIFKIKYFILQNESAKYNSAKNKGMEAKTSISKYTKTKNEYLSLTKKQQSLMSKNIELQKNKNSLLKTTAGKRVKAEQDIKELNNSAKALEALVKKLMAASTQKDKTRSIREKNTNTRKNSLPWPVDGGTLILKYGKNKHPDLDTNVISNGIKIKAQNNAIIKAVEEGTVVFTGEFRSYGKMIIVDHKGIFFSVYGQLNSIFVKEDQKVLRQEQLAKVGSGDNSVLYFEIRQYNVPEDPLLWLKEK
jgi:septal ring factor EnvC (AmiA/AmiB activator)